MTYERTRASLETYFDRTAADTWARLTSTDPVSRIRATVRAGRDRMRGILLSRLPEDMTGMRLLDAGCVANRSRDTDEVDRYGDVVGFKRLAHLPDLDAIRRSRLKQCTLFEMDSTEEDIVSVQKEYIKLAETLYAGTDPLAPAALEDRQIFELLGFD